MTFGVNTFGTLGIPLLPMASILFFFFFLIQIIQKEKQSNSQKPLYKVAHFSIMDWVKFKSVYSQFTYLVGICSDFKMLIL